MLQLHGRRRTIVAQGGRATRHQPHVRRKAQRRIQRLIQIAILDDPRQCTNMRTVGIESQRTGTARIVADDLHRIDCRHPRRIQRIPHPHRRQ